MESYKKVIVPVLDDERVCIFYPDGELIVSTTDANVCNDVRAQIYDHNIKGCYAVCNGERAEIDGDELWPFHHSATRILAHLIVAKKNFKLRNERNDTGRDKG